MDNIINYYEGWNYLSKAVINTVFREKGSGPLHTIFRVEGTYSYNKEDNNNSPFSLKIGRLP